MATRTPTPAPGGCSLSEPALAERIAWIRERIPAPREVRPRDGGVLLVFEHDAALRRTLADWVALEDACCDPERIRFRLLDTAPAGSLHLAIDGIDAQAPWLEQLGASPRAGRAGCCD